MRKILLGCLIIWTLFIFYQGTRSSSVSIQSSDKIVHPVGDVVEKVTPKSENELYQIVHFIVRKGAHLFEYAVLGGLLVAYFNQDLIHSLFGVLLCATLDEYL